MEISLDKKGIEYEFPSPSTSPQQITFQTRISDDKYFGANAVSLTNTAKIYDEGNNLVAEDDEVISFIPEWINKYVLEAGKNPLKPDDYKSSANISTGGTKDGEITWVIIANSLGADLRDVKIVDTLTVPMLHKETKYYKLQTDNTWGEESSISPSGDLTNPLTELEYSLGNVDKQILLVITTKLENNEQIGHEIVKIGNSGKIIWGSIAGEAGTGGEQGLPGTGPYANLGFNPIKKTSTAYDRKKHTIDWKVTLNKSDKKDNLFVVDLLVYGDTASFDKDWLENLEARLHYPNTIPPLENLQLTDFTAIKDDITARPYQKFESFTGDSAVFEAVVYSVKDSPAGNVVADLLVVTGKEGKGIELTAEKSFELTSKVTNPDIYASNKSTMVTNTATLFSNNIKVNSSNASRTYNSKFLIKDSGDFDYLKKELVYQIHINANELEDLAAGLTTLDNVLVGPLTFKDTLPEGWFFKKFDENDENNNYFRIYEAANSDTAIGHVSNLTELDSAQYGAFLTLPDPMITPTTNDGEELTLTFTNITKPYLLELKAGPDDATYEAYLKKNSSVESIVNKVNISSDKWTDGTSSSKTKEIDTRVLDKKSTLANESEGHITWTMEYKPYGLDIAEDLPLRLTDELPEELELRRDSLGNLIIGGNIVIKTGTLTDSGYVFDGPDIAQDMFDAGKLTYNNDQRKLVFSIEAADVKTAYQIVYITDIVEDLAKGKPITNTVTLDGVTLTESGSGSYTLTNNYLASATAERSGWIKITKRDFADDSVIANVEFQISPKAQPGLILRSGKTDANGVLTLRGLPEGDYTLKEVVPAGYKAVATEYELIVAEAGSVFSTSVAGKVGNSVTIYNIQTGTLGNLKIAKKLSGNNTDPAKEFTFTVTLADNTISGDFNYIGFGGKTDGKVTFAAGSATFTLKGNESIEILNLPKDLGYDVTENDYTADGYSTINIKNESGTIVADDIMEIEFTNRKHKSSGGGGDPDPKDPDPEKEDPTEKEKETEKDKPVEDKEEVDPDDKVEIEEEPENGTVEIDEDGNWKYTPDPGFTGEDKFVIKVTKPDGSEEEIVIIIDVDDIPLGTPDLPKTGVDSKLPQYLAGLLFIAAGLLLRRSVSK